MSKHIIVINGSGGVGKDTFMDYIGELVFIDKRSSVDIVKDAAQLLGWDGSKTEKDRKFLSDLKILSGEAYNHSQEYIKYCIDQFIYMSTSELLFLCIREPEEIEWVVKTFGATTLIIHNPNVELITTNMADNGVNSYIYDYTIDNNGSLEDLYMKAMTFISSADLKKITYRRETK